MRISAISDVHVKRPGDEADQLLCRFLDHSLVQSSDYILLLGDIFDLMCGPHDQYLELYQHLFDRMRNLSHAGKRFYFFEGNHDVHLEHLFTKVDPDKKLTARQDALIVDIEEKQYYFSHGDEHEVDNVSYQRYKKLILSPPLKFVANHLMPYSILNYIGERASKRSRKQGSRKFDEELVRERFRQGVMETTQGNYDFVLGGHSHVQDMYKFPNGKTLYLNNGYALRTKTFLFIENHQARFEPLL